MSTANVNTAPFDPAAPQIFVMNFITNLAHAAAFPSKEDVTQEQAATVQVASVSTTGSEEWLEACRKIVEEALAAEDEKCYMDGETVSPYEWSIGIWKEPVWEGIPHAVYTVTQDGEVAATMVIQRRQAFD